MSAFFYTTLKCVSIVIENQTLFISHTIETFTDVGAASKNICLLRPLTSVVDVNQEREAQNLLKEELAKDLTRLPKTTLKRLLM